MESVDPSIGQIHMYLGLHLGLDWVKVACTCLFTNEGNYLLTLRKFTQAQHHIIANQSLASRVHAESNLDK